MKATLTGEREVTISSGNISISICSDTMKGIVRKEGMIVQTDSFPSMQFSVTEYIDSVLKTFGE